MKENVNNRLIYLAIIIAIISFFSKNELLSQIDSAFNQKLQTEFLSFANSYFFKSNLYKRIEIDSFKIDFTNKFNSSILSQSNNSQDANQSNKFIRDDQFSNLNISKLISNNWGLFADANWLYTSNSVTFGLYELQRLNSFIGSRYSISKENSSYADLSLGYEKNTQIGTKANGIALRTNFNYNKIDLEEFKLDVISKAEYFNLSPNRLNADAGIESALYTNNENGNLRLIGRYKFLKRDYLNSGYLLSDLSYSTETRDENHIGLDLIMDYGFGDNFKFLFLSNYENVSIERSFKQGVANSDYTFVNRSLIENQFNINPYLYYTIDNFQIRSGLQLSYRIEENLVSQKFDITQSNLEKIKELEFERNNSFSRNKIFFNIYTKLSDTDSLNIESNYSLFRYDTPASENFDDRDEVSGLALLNYTKRIDSYTKVTLGLEYFYNHLIFIKSQRSSLNNNNKVLKFYPKILTINKLFSNLALFEVMANYTIYDFEVNPATSKSFSLRQILFKDSLILNISNMSYLSGLIFLRYFERGVLYWDIFSESPQTKNYESQFKFMINFKLNENAVFGIGYRYYNLDQKEIKINSISALNQFTQISSGPETSINVRWIDNSILRFSGWLENQRTNNAKRLFSNFSLVVIYFLN